MAKKTKNEEVETKAAKTDAKKAVSKKTEKAAEEKIVPRLREKYLKEIAPAMVKQFSYKNVNEVPKLEKIVVNIGVGGAVQDSKLLDEAVRDLETITGQKSSVRTAKQSISNFKLREGMKIGTKVTLRRQQMYEFLDRLVSIALPRVRDFRGIPDKSFDGRGNYTLGLKEHFIFPEINVDKVNRVLGMDITFVTTAKTDKESFELLSAFGLPFKKKEIN